MRRSGYLFMGVIVVLTLALALPSLLTAQDTTSQRTTSDVYPWPMADAEPIDGASSTLIRQDGGVSMMFYTSGLTPGDVVTIWWVIFNNPEFCNDGCGVDDLPISDGANPRVAASMLLADGQVVNSDGEAHYSGYLDIGDKPGEALWASPGLIDPQTAEIHLVARSHGPVILDLLAEQLNSFGAGCQGTPEGTGTAGPNTCANVRASVHLPPES